MRHRRSLILAAAAASIAGPLRRAMATPADDIFKRLRDAQTAGKVDGLHALLVSQAGRTICEYYGQGPDEKWGEPLGTVTFGPRTLHDLRSVSKSVVGLVYGIALADGKVPPPEAKLYEQFPEYADLAKQPGRDKLTLANVLSMTMGLEWDEFTYPYGDPRNSENAMVAAPDRYRFVLERPIVDEPGDKWTYCGGATALLGRLIERGTGQKLLAYARQVLFEPLGFGATDMITGKDGEPQAASGLRLLPPDLLKIGQLVLGRGKWGDRQVVPTDWLRQSFTPRVVLPDGRRYGYQWYLGQVSTGAPPRSRPWISGIGWGGQQLMLFPDLDTVVAMNCGNYQKPGREQFAITSLILTEIVLPSLQA